MNSNTIHSWIERVIQMAEDNAAKGEDPFAAIVVCGEKIVGAGVNCTHAANDPCAHAELLAIQEACKRLNRMDLSDCELYASGEPCPMCMGAIYWARLGTVYYACSKEEAKAAVGFSDPIGHFAADLARPPEQRAIPFRHIDSSRKLEPFRIWAKMHANDNN